MSNPTVGNTFPKGWSQDDNGMGGTYWHRKVEPVNSALVYALMSLPADAKVKHGETPYISGEDPDVTEIWYDPTDQTATLS